METKEEIKYTEGLFYIDDCNYAGIYDEKLWWNGWKSPFFKRGEADRVMENVCKANGEFKWDNDIITYEDKANEIIETYKPVILNDEMYWQVGGYSWIWSLFEIDKNYKLELTKLEKCYTGVISDYDLNLNEVDYKYYYVVSANNENEERIIKTHVDIRWIFDVPPNYELMEKKLKEALKHLNS